MKLDGYQEAMLSGQHGYANRKAMEILATLGTIYGAEGMVPVTSAQIAGVSYDNLGEAGLQFLSQMAAGGGRARVLTTLNPAGMDVENWQAMGISPEFARQQERVIAAFAQMNVITTCSCTPYLTGNVPHYGEHIAWSESSAVCYANSVLGARTNREGGPSALAAALTGFTPAYGLHLEQNRQPGVTVHVRAAVKETVDFGMLGRVIGERLEARGHNRLPYLVGLQEASLEGLKSFCASIATYGGVAMFHARGITPEAAAVTPPDDSFTVDQEDLDRARQAASDALPEEIDFVSLGCPHLSLSEIAYIAERLKGQKVKKTFWITTARPIRQIAERMGYTQIIEESGAVLASDTCCVVAPIRSRFHALATDSAKACYYAYAKNKFKTRIGTFDEVIAEALR